MAWTNTQKHTGFLGCHAAGISEAQRHMILRQFDNARGRDGKISSTAPKLTSRDFEQFMAIVERHAGGKLLDFTAGYWQGCAEDGLSRMRSRAEKLVEVLEAAGCLAAGGVGLAGWISKCVSGGETDRLEDLDYHGLLALTLGLQSWAKQHAVAVKLLSRWD